VRPVAGVNRTRARLFLTASTSQLVTAGLPFASGTIRQPCSRLEILASASAMLPPLPSGTPSRIAT
jgi:hypothetical protein